MTLIQTKQRGALLLCTQAANRRGRSHESKCDSAAADMFPDVNYAAASGHILFVRVPSVWS